MLLKFNFRVGLLAHRGARDPWKSTFFARGTDTDSPREKFTLVKDHLHPLLLPKSFANSPCFKLSLFYTCIFVDYKLL